MTRITIIDQATGQRTEDHYPLVQTGPGGDYISQLNPAPRVPWDLNRVTIVLLILVVTLALTALFSPAVFLGGLLFVIITLALVGLLL